MPSSRQKRMADALRREIERGVVKAAAPAKPNALLDGLRNVRRTATRALDEAGVPDQFQGIDGEWEDYDD